MKNDLIWTKTVLSVYRYLDRICDAIDKIVLNTGLSSRNINQMNYFCNNVMSISQKIIKLSQRKINLINLKLLANKCFRKINKTDAKLLILCYIDGTKRRELAEKYQISMRTVFRRIESAETAFSKALHMQGYSDEKLEEMLHEENWIKSVYNRYVKGEEKEQIELSSCYITKAAAM